MGGLNEQKSVGMHLQHILSVEETRGGGDYVDDDDGDGNSDEKKADSFVDVEKKLYHEKQQLELCLLHAINALLGRSVFSTKSLDAICKELAPDKLINPHKSILQTGNYDANVLMAALGKENITVQWFDARKAADIDLESKAFLSGDQGEFQGFILNKPTKAMFNLLNRRHWLTIKRVDGNWYNLDSKLKKPDAFKNAKEAGQFLQKALKENKAELMICRAVQKKADKQEK